MEEVTFTLRTLTPLFLAGADQTKSASATVVVSPAPVASIAIDPAAADLTPGATLQLRETGFHGIAVTRALEHDVDGVADDLAGIERARFLELCG